MAKSEFIKVFKQYEIEEELNPSDVDANPYQTFQQWFQNAINQKVTEPNAMCLATADAQGQPSARMVLLKQHHEHQFIFFTNYNSLKGQQIDENPKASILFYWEPLYQQIRIEGEITPVSKEISSNYFDSRPAESRAGAIASNQSAPLTNKTAFKTEVNELVKSTNLERPNYWGGYQIIANKYEFWQGRKSRLHDRIVYFKQADGTWKMEAQYP